MAVKDTTNQLSVRNGVQVQVTQADIACLRALKARGIDLVDFDEQLLKREEAVYDLERELEERETEIEDRELELEEQAADLQEREEALEQREDDFREKRVDLDDAFQRIVELADSIREEADSNIE